MMNWWEYLNTWVFVIETLRCTMALHIVPLSNVHSNQFISKAFFFSSLLFEICVCRACTLYLFVVFSMLTTSDDYKHCVNIDTTSSLNERERNNRNIKIEFNVLYSLTALKYHYQHKPKPNPNPVMMCRVLSGRNEDIQTVFDFFSLFVFKKDNTWFIIFTMQTNIKPKITALVSRRSSKKIHLTENRRIINEK